jgi:DNA-binding transcriptional ArsR family regulator
MRSEARGEQKGEGRPWTPLDYRQMARLAGALSDTTRLRLLVLLCERGEMTVGDLTAAVQGSQSATSRHLSILTDANLVWPERRGKFVYYQPVEDAPALLEDLRDWLPGPPGLLVD